MLAKTNRPVIFESSQSLPTCIYVHTGNVRRIDVNRRGHLPVPYSLVFQGTKKVPVGTGSGRNRTEARNQKPEMDPLTGQAVMRTPINANKNELTSNMELPVIL
jgi:hypothetical protein